MTKQIDKIVLSGGPHSGKTTLLREIQLQKPNLVTTSEPASNVIAKHTTGDELNFWTDVANSPCKFSRLCMEEAVALEAGIPTSTPVVLMDRALGDTLGYARKDGCKTLTRSIEALARTAAYDTVLFCEPVGQHANRPEDYEEALLIAKHIRQSYQDLGVDIVDVPALPVNERVDYVFDVLGSRLP